MLIDRTFGDFWTDDLAGRTGYIEKRGDCNPKISSLVYDSRTVTQDSLFFAFAGLHTDGHAYIDSAIQNGARVIVHDKEIAAPRNDVLYLRVKNARFAMSPLANAFYRESSSHLHITGVTGTEGKSTTVYLIFQLLRFAGKKCGFISTVQYSVDGVEQTNPEHQTTPEAVQIHRRLFEMLEHGAEYAVLESSSHGLSPRTNRLGDIDFDAAVMTNVTHEHLEFHGTWEQYRGDKANLFRALDRACHHKTIGGTAKEAPVFGIVNEHDPSAAYFRQATGKEVISFNAAGGAADYRITGISSGEEGNEWRFLESASGASFTLTDRLPGAFNAGNVLAALIAVSRILACPVSELCAFVPRLIPVRGRMTAVKRGQPFEVLVDYAHTPSSFQTIFPPLRERLDKRGGRIIALFGSPGERDTQKRPAQGKAADQWADIIILTDEDPRGEEPMVILEEIAAGINGKRRGESLFLIPERPEAVRKAFSLAQTGDLVLLLGKGHENSIIYSGGGRRAMAYDEIAEAEKALAELSW